MVFGKCSGPGGETSSIPSWLTGPLTLRQRPWGSPLKD